MAIYRIYNGPMPTTASQAAVSTGTSILTLLQVKATSPLVRVVEWGISFNGPTAAVVGVECELLETAAVFATMSALVDADIHHTFGAAASSYLTLAVAGNSFLATGYTASAEGTVAATTIHDAVFVQPNANYCKVFEKGREVFPVVGNSLRIRVKAAAAYNAICYMVLEI